MNGTLRFRGLLSNDSFLDEDEDEIIFPPVPDFVKALPR